MAAPICLVLERQAAERAFSRAWAKTGNRIAARMAMIAITTRSSISVKPRREETGRIYLPPWPACPADPVSVGFPVGACAGGSPRAPGGTGAPDRPGGPPRRDGG